MPMIKVYVTCLKRIAAEKGVVLSRTEEARRITAAKKIMKSLPDKTSQYGPPDHADTFLTSATSRDHILVILQNVRLCALIGVWLNASLTVIQKFLENVQE